MNQLNRFGFKKLTIENCFEDDEISVLFWEMNVKTGESRQMNGEDWAKYILEPKLNSNVPVPVQRLFEVARGVLIYGNFFYPLFTVGIEQLSRVCETAITEKCLELELKKRNNSFDSKIKALCEESVISEEDIEFWQNIRQLRNHFSHPKNQNLFPPGICLGMMKTITEKINDLFDV